MNPDGHMHLCATSVIKLELSQQTVGEAWLCREAQGGGTKGREQRAQACLHNDAAEAHVTALRSFTVAFLQAVPFLTSPGVFSEVLELSLRAPRMSP